MIRWKTQPTTKNPLNTMLKLIKLKTHSKRIVPIKQYLSRNQVKSPLPKTLSHYRTVHLSINPSQLRHLLKKITLFEHMKKTTSSMKMKMKVMEEIPRSKPTQMKKTQSHLTVLKETADCHRKMKRINQLALLKRKRQLIMNSTQF